MPQAILRACAGGCGTFHRAGTRCLACKARYEGDRQTATRRGYGRDWTYFRPTFLGLLVAAGVLPVCGAALPTGPQTEDSACRRAGLLTFTSLNGSSLHLDHEPALRDEERANAAAVCDPTRIQLLCDACHAKKAEAQPWRPMLA